MAKLKAAQRNRLPDSAFVFKKDRRFPIHDLAHAQAALRLCGRTGDCEKVRRAVCRKFGSKVKACSTHR